VVRIDYLPLCMPPRFFLSSTSLPIRSRYWRFSRFVMRFNASSFARLWLFGFSRNRDSLISTSRLLRCSVLLNRRSMLSNVSPFFLLISVTNYGHLPFYMYTTSVVSLLPPYHKRRVLQNIVSIRTMLKQFGASSAVSPELWRYQRSPGCHFPYPAAEQCYPVLPFALK